MNAQNYLIQNGVVSTCSGNFYDSGKDTTTYQANENLTMTICSDVPGMCVSIQFTQFDLENGFDFLYAYNGPTANSPIIGTYTGSISPGTITATSGCLTIKFVSDYTVNKNGWSGIINCAPCPVNGCPSCTGGLPPANDACSAAQNLGVLPIPVACPIGTGAVATFNTTNICATAEIPYNALQNCDPVGNMATPASDVWYKFTLTAPILNVTVNGMITPQVGLYSGSGCNNLVPRGCAIGGGGLLNSSFSGLSAGTYYLRVSGGTLTDQCNFTLSLQNNFDCQGCVLQSALNVNPPPQNGIYLAGQPVQFCLSISDFSPASANWLHAVIPTFGDGWDTTTLTFSPPVSCSGNGTWSWYNQQITSSGNAGFSVGPGFFYETAAGNPLGVADLNPGNNFGDNIANGCNLNFCFTIKTKEQIYCIHGENLNVFIDTYSDGESGAWTSVACSSDPVNDFYASIACCIPPTIAVSNAKCNGQTGSAVGTGLGNSPWTFIWKDASGTIIRQHSSFTKDSITNAQPGQYTLVTVDAFGCESQTVFVITEPQVLNATIIVNDTKCAVNNGLITVNVTGGTAPYAYSKNNGAVFQGASYFSNLAPGNYDIVIRDINGCTFSVTVTVDPSTLPVINSVNIVDVTCFNGTDGSLTINASGGVGPYSYSNGGAFQVGNQFINLQSKNYTLIVSDVFGCTTSTTVNIGQPPPVDINAIVIPADCGLNNGAITINVLSGGVGSLLYSINAGQAFQASNQFVNLFPGLYTIVIQDANGCLAYDTATVNNLNAPAINSVAVTNSTCYGSNNGSITINASGGVGVLQYSINNGTTFFATNFFNNLPDANYKIVVKDANGCISSTTTNVTEPAPISLSADLTTTQCGLSNGVININLTNGIPPFQYSIDNGVTFFPTDIFQNLAAGNYTVVITDATGCTRTRVFNITSSSAPSVSSSTIVDATCFGAVTGSISVNTTGGTPPIKFSIDGGVTFVNSGTFNGLVAGNYNIIVQDVGGCSTTNPFVINQPAQLLLNVNSTDAICGLPNGTLALAGAGGTLPYTYSKDGGLSFGIANNFNALAAGNYKVVIMDDNGCVEASTVTILDAVGPRIIAFNATSQICTGTTNASINLTAVSGTGVLQFSIDSGITQQPSNIFNNLSAGTYHAYVEDINGCKDSVVIPVSILASPQINLINSTDLTCYQSANGTIQIAASGGNGALLFSINNGSVFATDTYYDSLAAGSYVVIVEDTNQCEARDTIILTQPSQLNVTASTIPERCFRNDGEISLHGTGGTPGYLFSLNNNALIIDSVFGLLDSGTYNMHIVDLNGCEDSVSVLVSFLSAPTINSVLLSDETCRLNDNGIITILSSGNGNLQYTIDGGFNNQTSNVFDSLAAGNYTVSVIDTNNCKTDSAVVINEPAGFNFSFVATDANCNFSNGSFTINVTGGTGVLTYSINGINFTANPTFSNLSSGNYTVTVKDANGCTEDFVASVNNVNGPVILNISNTTLFCNADSSAQISISANGGTGVLTYSIDNGINFSTNNIFQNLTAGNYAIIVKDAVGCEATDALTITEPDALVINSLTTDAACGQSNGSIALNVTGGTGIIQYSIDSGLTYQASPNFNNLFAGTYFVMVKDANNCKDLKIISVNNLLAPTINSLALTHNKCYNDKLGIINLYASGGTGALSYTINGGSLISTALWDSLPAGNYQIVVTDQNGCIDDSLVVITQPQQIIAQTQTTTANCNQSNGSILVNAQGGIGVLNYSLDSIAFVVSNTFNNLAAGNYTVYVRDANSCAVTFPVSVSNLNGPVISGIVKIDLDCNGDSDGTILINANGGSGALQFSINNGSSFSASNSFSSLIAGTYQIVVADTAGCNETAVIDILQPPAIVVASTNYNTACGQNNGAIAVTASGGTGSLLFAMDSVTFSAVDSFPNLFAGAYTITVMDANNCLVYYHTNVNNILAPAITNVTKKDLTCYNNNTGEIKIFAAGGFGVLSYSINNGVSYQSSNVFNAIAAGTYAVAVKDANGCIANSTITINQPDSLANNITFSNELCSYNNGSILINATGGTTPYLYSTDSGTVYTNTFNYTSLNAGTFNVIVKDNKGCKTSEQIIINDLAAPQINNTLITNVNCYDESNGVLQPVTTNGNGTLLYTLNHTLAQTSNIFDSLVAGNYTIVVTDTNQCADSVSVNVLQPNALYSAENITNAKCFGNADGAVVVSVSGGTSPYNIQWSTGISNDFSLGNLQAGNYFYTITDNHNCLRNDSALITQPNVLVIAANATNGSCAGAANATATVNVTGGTTPYSYAWSPISSNTNYAANLSAGAFTVTVTDLNLCTQSYQINIVDPLPVTAAVNAFDVTCFGGDNGSALITPSGGYAPYSFYWLSLNSNDSIVDSLAAGNYDVLITDNNGCTYQQTVSITQPTAVNVFGTITPASCNGYSNGNISLNISGGVQPYNYVWSTGSVTSIASQLAAGNYSVTITDDNNCVKDVSFLVTEPTPVLVTSTTPDTICIGQSAIAIATANGGNGNYSYTWNNGIVSDTLNINPSSTTAYSVIATDSVGCFSNPLGVNVNVFPPLQVSLNALDTICEGEVISLTAQPAGGNGGPYSYTWSPVNTNAQTVNYSPNTDATFTVSITDNCTALPASANSDIVVNPLPDVDFTISLNEGCMPLEVSFINQSITATGSTYQWDLGNGFTDTNANTNYTYTEHGNYDVTLVVTTPELCTDSLVKPNAVNVFENPVAAFTPSPATATILDAEIDFTDNSYLGATWQWNFGNGIGFSQLQNPAYVYPDTGVYNVQLIVGSDKQCYDTTYAQIEITGAYTLYIPNAFTPNNDNKNDFFFANGYGITSIKTLIFNRWGNKIFETSSLHGKWNGRSEDGNQCPVGVYVYFIEVTDMFGKPHRYEGRVSLIK